jgi:ubiquinone biosynthesis protein COQ9
MSQPENTDLDALIDAALPHVAFDGWSETTFKAALADSGIDPGLAAALCPKGATDLAVAAHRRGDQQMVEALKTRDLSTLRYSEKVAEAVKTRLQVAGDKEVVRRGTTLFTLPHNAPLGAKAIWDTADAIWTALGDTSTDVNWYTKRATLSGVYSATVLFWLGDDSDGDSDTWLFLDRRIEDVMRIEKLKAQVNENPILKTVLAGPNWFLSRVRAPSKMPDFDLPGSWQRPEG